MRNVCLFILTLCAGMIFAVSDLQAFPVLGYVDPGFSNGYDLGSSTTGTATYYFKNLPSTIPGGLTLSSLVLTFEGDVFDLTNTTPIAGTQNPGWIFKPTLNLGSYEIEILTSQPGMGIPEGDQLTFQVNFTLLDDALTLNPLWDEGGYWQQAFGAKIKTAAGADVQLPFGGSTSPIPEPGTMVLLGISVLSFAGYAKARMK